jgi:hypothetical protein
MTLAHQLGTMAKSEAKRPSDTTQNPSHWTDGADYSGWSSARGKGGGNGGRGETDQEYGHGVHGGNAARSRKARGGSAPPKK